MGPVPEHGWRPFLLSQRDFVQKIGALAVSLPSLHFYILHLYYKCTIRLEKDLFL